MSLALRLVVALICLACPFSIQTAVADESLRISRPTFVMPEVLRFSIGRQKLFTDQFEQWRRQYCHPVVCPDITCAGSCSAYADSCPSFSGLTVFDLRHGSATLITNNGCSSQCSDVADEPSGAAQQSASPPGCCR